jgi:hypothetical protein
LEDSDADKFAAIKVALAEQIAREFQTGVGTVLRIKAIWLSNREDVVVGHYTPDATAKNESTAPAESRRGILFGVVKVSAGATLTGPRPSAQIALMLRAMRLRRV